MNITFIFKNMNCLYLAAAISILLPSASCITCLEGAQAIAFSNLTTVSCAVGEICNRVDATITVAGDTTGPWVTAECVPAAQCIYLNCNALAAVFSGTSITSRDCCAYCCGTDNCNVQSGFAQGRTECNGTVSGFQQLTSKPSITLFACMLALFV